MPSFTVFIASSLVTFSLILSYRWPYSSSRSSSLVALSAAVAHILAWLIWRCILYPKLFSPLRRLPGPSGGNFFMGQFFEAQKGPNGEVQRRWIEEIPNDGLIRYLSIFNNERVLLASPKALAEVLTHRVYEFPKMPHIAALFGKIFGIGVLLAEGEEHKRQRKALAPAFAFRHTKDMYPIFWKKSGDLIKALETITKNVPSIVDQNSSTIDVCDWASRVTLDIIGVAGLGRDFKAIQEPDNSLNQTYNMLLRPSRKARAIGALGLVFPSWLIRSLRLERYNNIDSASKVIKETCYSLVREAKQKVQEPKAVDHNILSVALESGDFSEEDLVNQMMTFLIAGHETTAAALSWSVCMLCKYPEIQRRLRDEIRSTLPDVRSSDTAISASQIDNLAYLNAVINEVLRVYPPIPVTARCSAQDTILLGQFVPKGTTIFIAPWAINTSKELWGNDAAEFKPDRWLGEGRANSGGADSNYSFLTFLQGPRSCIGLGFAKGELACLLAAWVGTFETSFAQEDYSVGVKNGLAAKPKDLFVRLKVLDEY